MLGWIILIAVVIAVIILAVKTKHFRHKFFIFTIIIVALFFITTFYYVQQKNNLDTSSFNGLVHSAGVYTGWLVNGFGNLKAITGYAVKLDWTNTNSSSSSVGNLGTK